MFRYVILRRGKEEEEAAAAPNTETDDCQLFLWGGIDADFQHVDDDVDGVYAEEVIVGSGTQQLYAQHILMRGLVRHGAYHQGYRQWVDFYNSRVGGHCKQPSHIGDEDLRASVETDTHELRLLSSRCTLQCLVWFCLFQHSVFFDAELCIGGL